LLKFYGEAPGKAILLGEHLVVHGANAVAAAISRTVVAQVALSEYDEVESYARSSDGHRIHLRRIPAGPLTKCIEATKKFLSCNRHVNVRIISSIPISAGLGSSAACAVATVAATGLAFGSSLSLREIFEIALNTEKEIHGNPSGIDIEASAKGGVILFSRSGGARRIERPAPISLVLADSGVSRNTSKIIQLVSKNRNHLPSYFASLLAACNKMASLMEESIRKADLPMIAAIMSWNHAVLKSLAASSNIVDCLVDRCLKSGCIGAKVTGAGGGGFVVGVPPMGKETAVLSNLRRAGVSAFISRIPSEGVRVWKSKT
jgi:mevalonate kinase